MELDVAIVVIGYNRWTSLKRLLNKLSEAHYNQLVTLIVSIDYSDKIIEIKEHLENFKWNYGEYKIIIQESNLGLRKHIIKCGDFSNDYDAIIMFEDDIVPSPYFFDYAIKAIAYYKSKDFVGGISLYSPNQNEMVEKPFQPLKNDKDTYLLKSASSWGQCWTKEMWFDFKEWYNENQMLENTGDMPQKIYSWPDSSWKKYFMKYLVVKNKYFVYPYFSLSTNFSDIGTHVAMKMSQYQVPILYGEIDYNFCDFDNGVKYDQFFENEKLLISIKDNNNDSESVDVDLYGSKNKTSCRYILSTRLLNYKIMKSYGLDYRPIELNVLKNNGGEGIYLYDKNVVEKNKKNKFHQNNLIIQYYSNINWKDACIYFVNSFIKIMCKFILNRRR